MKTTIVLLTLITFATYAQKTTRESVSNFRGMIITKVMTEVDTTFIMMGQNAQYSQIVDLIVIKHGSAQEIDELLTECMKLLPEKDGTSLEFNGNSIYSMGGNKLLLSGIGNDSRDSVLLNKGLITRLQTDLRKYL